MDCAFLHLRRGRRKTHDARRTTHISHSRASQPAVPAQVFGARIGICSLISCCCRSACLCGSVVGALHSLLQQPQHFVTHHPAEPLHAAQHSTPTFALCARCRPWTCCLASATAAAACTKYRRQPRSPCDPAARIAHACVAPQLVVALACILTSSPAVARRPSTVEAPHSHSTTSADPLCCHAPVASQRACPGTSPAPAVNALELQAVHLALSFCALPHSRPGH